MASKDTARRKYVDKTSDEFALGSMKDKLTAYLKPPKPFTDETPPIAAWKSGDKDAWFEKCYGRMQEAYGIEVKK